MLDYQELKENLGASEDYNDQARKEKKNFIIKINELQKNNAKLDKDFSRIQAENNTLSSKNTHLTERYNDLKTKLQQKEN